MRLTEKPATSPLVSSWPSLWGLTFTLRTAAHPRARSPLVVVTESIVTKSVGAHPPHRTRRARSRTTAAARPPKRKDQKTETATIRRIREFHSLRASLRSIAVHLDAEGYGPRMGGAWQSRCLSRILQREATESLGADALLLKGQIYDLVPRL
jgi:hypothetical protein